MERNYATALILGDKYYSIDDLRYNKKIGILLSRDEFEAFLDCKDALVSENFEHIKRLPLKTFNSKFCFYVDGLYLLKTQNEYLRICASDYELNQASLFERNAEDMIISRLFSEIEGTLNIESIPTTHKHIQQVSKNESPVEKNDIIIKNMIEAIRFIIS